MQFGKKNNTFGTSKIFSKEIFMSTLLDVNTVAQKLSLTPQQVRNLCRSGKLKAKKIGPNWVIEETHAQYHYDNNSCGVAEDQVSYITRDELCEKKKPIALSFFSGAMGLDIGIEKAGFKTILASEIDNASRKTIKKNKPDIALIGNILDYTATEIKQIAQIKDGDDIDLIMGGPPCQAFSTAGKRKGFEDQRGNVFLSFIDLIHELRPKFAVIENVRGLLSAPLNHVPHILRDKNKKISEKETKGGALAYIIEKLKESGYSVSFNLYNSANFGTPQKRERIIIICSRDGKKIPYLEPTHSENGSFNLPKWKTFREAVKGLEKEKQHYIEFPEKRLKYYRLLKAGQNWRNLSPELQREALGASFFSGGGKTGFYRRLDWDSPSPTLVTHPAMPATDLCHPAENRPLSIEEYKRIQEFPSEWQIEGSLVEQYRQIGNAVPTSLGHAVGKILMKILNEEKINSFQDFPYSRYKATNEHEWLAEFQKNKNEIPMEFL